MEKCNACGRTDGDIGKCGAFATCPKVGHPLADNDVVLRCDHCGITRAVSAGAIIQGKPLVANAQCPISNCQAKAVFMTTVEPAKEAETRHHARVDTDLGGDATKAAAGNKKATARPTGSANAKGSAH